MKLIFIVVGLLGSFSARASLSLADMKVKKEVLSRIEGENKEMIAACGCKPDYKIEWETLADNSANKDVRDIALENVYGCIQAVKYAFQEICVPDKTDEDAKSIRKKMCDTIKTVAVTKPPASDKALSEMGKAPESVLNAKAKSLTLYSRAGRGCQGASWVKEEIERGL